MAAYTKNIMIEHADIRFRNFSGNETRFNPAGKRNFCVLLDHEVATAMEEDGWNVKTLKPRDDGEDPQDYIQVTVHYGNIEPKIWLVTATNKTLLTEETVGSLDYAEIADVDLVLRPYNWEVNGKSGIKAYLKTMYVTIAEDEFASKYYSVPESGAEPDDEVPFS